MLCFELSRSVIFYYYVWRFSMLDYGINPRPPKHTQEVTIWDKRFLPHHQRYVCCSGSACTTACRPCRWRRHLRSEEPAEPPRRIWLRTSSVSLVLAMLFLMCIMDSWEHRLGWRSIFFTACRGAIVISTLNILSVSGEERRPTHILLK